MKITQIHGDAIQLTRLGFVNCYLVRERGAAGEPDTFTLIDTGLAGSGQAILAAAEAARAPIRRILLTHAHVDHVGSVDELASKLPGVVLAANERSLPLLRKPADKTLRPGEPQERFGGGLPGIRTPVTHILRDGELFGSLRVIPTPGHIPGHLSFLDERDGTLYAGDELQSIGRLAINGWNAWYFPLPQWVMWSRKLALASARHLLDFPIQRFACGHGRIVDGGVAALKPLVDAASQ